MTPQHNIPAPTAEQGGESAHESEEGMNMKNQHVLPSSMSIITNQV
jgi:hypothetical protein